jgi:hypothetical protein
MVSHAVQAETLRDEDIPELAPEVLGGAADPTEMQGDLANFLPHMHAIQFSIDAKQCSKRLIILKPLVRLAE